MSPDVLIIDGRAYSWRQLRTLRQQQLAARRAEQGRQEFLFEVKHDCRPAAERTAARRFAEPSLLEWIVARQR